MFINKRKARAVREGMLVLIGAILIILLDLAWALAKRLSVLFCIYLVVLAAARYVDATGGLNPFH